jgi:hypothetical protein
MAYKIFISFDSKDLDLARDLSKRLEKVGLTVTSSSSKIDNERLEKGHIEGLIKADEVIFLITNNAIEGKRVFFEMGAADALEKRLATILVGLRPKELPDIFKGLDYIKYDELERYIGRLRHKVEETSKLSAA